jgi:hypothetical protein
VLEPIPEWVLGRVAQAEVGPEVDDRDPSVDELRHHGRRGAVREGEEDRIDVVLGKGVGDPVGGPREVRMADVDRLILASPRLEAHDPHRRVPFEQPHQLAAAVAGGADDADPYLLAHEWRILVP